ncbi:TNF receptor-associated factor 6-like [Rhipicephalus sanguineus]|uniref:TNF receptor-associated factor 6-like n=1 Tax=Rhipicephalus sanguineus TaxID=34632 RepID=UPI001893C306|nr:TNF receptor-associated factor 6-like [Rhipicephalus sanguineus]
MAPANQQYTLVGFTEDLDWHPLQFVKSLPRNKLCSVCGLVRKTTVNLTCGHVACHFCYEQCKTADGYACPIDGEICLEEDVGWIDFPAENLLKREVKCWNQRHGCPLMMAASEVHKHFHRECGYHCTPCPRCSTMVLCRDMGEHLRASCNTHAAPQAPDGEEKLSDAVEKAISTVVRRVVQEQAGEMKALLERALGDNGVLNDSLTEVSQNMNSLREAVIQSIAPVGHISEMTHRVLDGINTLHEALNSEIADTIKQNAEFPRVRAAIESAKEDAGASTKTILEIQKKALAYPEKTEGRCDFFVSGIASLEAKAVKDGDADYYSPKFYLRGYNISPGVELRREEEDMFLNLLLQLHRGEHDDVVLWPFEHKIKLTIRHPLKNEEKNVIRTATRGFESFKKPTMSSNSPVYFGNCFKLGDLKTGGYVRDDKLRVLVELL